MTNVSDRDWDNGTAGHGGQPAHNAADVIDSTFHMSSTINK